MYIHLPSKCLENTFKYFYQQRYKRGTQLVNNYFLSYIRVGRACTSTIYRIASSLKAIISVAYSERHTKVYIVYMPKLSHVILMHKSIVSCFPQSKTRKLSPCPVRTVLYSAETEQKQKTRQILTPLIIEKCLRLARRGNTSRLKRSINIKHPYKKIILIIFYV